MLPLERGGLLRGACAWAAGLTLVSAGLAALVSGGSAALGCVVGGIVTGASVLVLARGLAALQLGRVAADRAGRRAIAGFLGRHLVVGAMLWLAVSAGLPAGWMIVGVTAWPIALLAEGLRQVSHPSSARAEG